MPLERDKILVDNLLACLNLYQTSLVWALTAAVVFFLLTVRLRAPSQSTIPPFSTASNPTTAWLIALALCLVLGSLALTALHRAEAIFMKLSLSSELLEAILLYPSLATNQSRVARVGSVLLCPLAVAAGIVMAIRHEFTREAWHWQHLSSAPWGWYFLCALIILAVYGGIAGRIWIPFGSY
jgi:intracellular septation protein A